MAVENQNQLEVQVVWHQEGQLVQVRALSVQVETPAEGLVPLEDLASLEAPDPLEVAAFLASGAVPKIGLHH